MNIGRINHRTRKGSRPGRWLSIGLLLSLLAFTSSAQQALKILIIKSDSSNVYDEVVNTIQQQLRSNCEMKPAGCRPIEIQSFVANNSKPVYERYDLAIALGMKARYYTRQYLAETQALNAMIPAEFAAADDIPEDRGQNNLLLLDQPIHRVVGLITQCLPEAQKIGVLYSERNRPQVAKLEKQAAKRGLSIVATFVKDDNELGKQLSQLLQEIDVLLALPDVRIHNRSTVTNILLSSYRNRVPMIAFSAAYVRAGALGAVYSTPEEIGSHLGEVIEEFSRNKRLQLRHNYPKYFSISLNHPVARSLNIQLPEESFIEQQLEAGEKR